MNALNEIGGGTPLQMAWDNNSKVQGIDVEEQIPLGE